MSKSAGIREDCSLLFLSEINFQYSPNFVMIWPKKCKLLIFSILHFSLCIIEISELSFLFKSNDCFPNSLNFNSFSIYKNDPSYGQAHFSLKWLWWTIHIVRMSSRIIFVKKDLCPRINIAVWATGLKKRGYGQKNNKTTST